MFAYDNNVCINPRICDFCCSCCRCSVTRKNRLKHTVQYTMHCNDQHKLQDARATLNSAGANLAPKN